MNVLNTFWRRHAVLLFAGAILASVPVNALAGGTGECGDGLPDPGEACDDGNLIAGDGCSAACRVETGFACSPAVPETIINAVANGNFEAESAGTDVWEFQSTQFGTPLCTLASCGGGTAQPQSGAGWVWFGGALSAEDAFIEQSITLLSTDTQLEFDVAQDVCDSAADALVVTLDSNPVLTLTGADASCGNTPYRRVQVDLTTAPGGPYNDGQAHTLRMAAQTQSLNGGETNFLIDNVGVIRGTTAGTPSACSALTNTCRTEDFDPAMAGDFTTIGWSSFFGVDDAIGLTWSSSDAAACRSDNRTGSSGEAACVDSDAAGFGIGDSYLCADALDLRDLVQTTLRFSYAYQTFGPADANDVFEVVAGVTPPDSTSVADYATIWSADPVTADTVDGVQRAIATADLSAFDSATEAFYCFHFRGDFDWRAQVDDVTVISPSCNAADADGDGVLNSIDNCLEVSNPLQTDSNGDGIGNRCDADIAGPLGIGDDDCVVNVLDLGALRVAFGANPDSANWNPHADFAGADGPPDGQINAVDLGRLKLGFFQPPGPSAAGCQR